ncbi:MAG: phosphatidate cytidylyltransferase [candidate division WOR-3 bacterium]
MAQFKDLLKRTKTGFFLVSIVVLTLWIDNILLPLLLLFFITFATNEYFRFWHRKDIYPHTLAVLFPGYTIPFLFYFEIPLLLSGFILFFFITLLSVMRFPGSRRKPNFLAEVSANFFGVFYISLLPSTIILLRKHGFCISLLPLVLTWIYDTFAYIIGSLWGKHRLAEKLSPKKSIEGTFAAFFLTFPFTLWLNSLWAKNFNLFDAIWITLGIGVLGTVGDLFESGMKREVGLKDASNVFPGHGGFLDRLDSLIFNIPFFYIYFLTRG